VVELFKFFKVCFLSCSLLAAIYGSMQITGAVLVGVPAKEQRVAVKFDRVSSACVD